MRLKGFRLSTVVLATILEPDLCKCQQRVTRGGEKSECKVLASRTWTSFSPSETRFTILARNILSGFGFL